MKDRWPLTGRGEELRLICEAFADDEHRGMIVAGDAGVGKTRLARDAVELANDTWSVHRVAGTTTGRAISLGAFARWAGDADTSPAALVRKVINGLTADGKPLLLFVDDAHLLDDLSAMVVHQLVLQDAAKVVATLRTGQPAPDAITALWKDRLLRRLELQPLSRAETITLLEAGLGGSWHSDATSRMWKLTQGNALFLRHLLDQELESGRLIDDAGVWTWRGASAVSPSLIELVELQIGAVTGDVRDVVDLVAVAEPLPRSCLDTLADAEAIETAEERGLITTSADGIVQVGHPLYGEVRLNQCGRSRLRRLRAEVAGALVADPDADPLILGILWLDSGLTPDAQVMTRAALAAQARFDMELSEQLARAAAKVSDDPAVTLLLASVLLLREDGTGVEDLLSSLPPQEMPTPVFHNAVNLRANNLLFTLRDRDKSWAVIEQALRSTPDNTDQLRTFAGLWLVTAGRPAEALEMNSAIDHAGLDSFGTIVARSTETLALGDLGRPGLAAERAAAAYAALTEAPHESFQGSGIVEFHAYALLAAGYPAAAAELVRRKLSADAFGPTAAMAVAAAGMTALGVGDLTAATEQLGHATAALGDYGKVIGLPYRFHIMHAEALARTGHIDAAAATLAVAESHRHPAYMYVESTFLLAKAWLAASHGAVSEAREYGYAAAEYARHHGQWAREVLALQAVAQFGDGAVTGRLTELADTVEGPRAALAAQLAWALAQHDGTALDAVSDDFETMGDRLAAADAAGHASVAHRQAGRRGSALTSSARADRIAHECGGAVSPALASARIPLPFTQREREVARLVSQGLSNREIATAMSLSVRTVEGYVYQASSKAGVTARNDLAALVRQFD
ncbi:LuxR family transcriptional regulator [Mycolicibacterium sp. P9-22]|uniref:helix-turn-helix transcriptional regulator n=1 Tax=Mycolicibacterium sp. P9-22 TaxID=2024613 RepID=UPI0011EE0A72|nr:LuxR family transcriptional regulator [Mycolicibacterium sp. P9-22]KAA0108477.1 LuxR family transcriptional regulator [Mycolicibacterium sp. P9-22]